MIIILNYIYNINVKLYILYYLYIRNLIMYFFIKIENKKYYLIK